MAKAGELLFQHLLLTQERLWLNQFISDLRKIWVSQLSARPALRMSALCQAKVLDMIECVNGQWTERELQCHQETCSQACAAFGPSASYKPPCHLQSVLHSWLLEVVILYLGDFRGALLEGGLILNLAFWYAIWVQDGRCGASCADAPLKHLSFQIPTHRLTPGASKTWRPTLHSFLPRAFMSFPFALASLTSPWKVPQYCLQHVVLPEYLC